MSKFISEISHSLNILFSIKNRRENTSQDSGSLAVDLQLNHTLKHSINSVYEYVADSTELSAAVTECAPVVLQPLDDSQVEWRFVQWNLVLLSLLGKALGNTAIPLDDVLGSKQQKALHKCVQAILALGVCPSLIPGIGVPLDKRFGFSDHINNSQSCTIKHRHLVVCTVTLLKTLKLSPLLAVVILQRYLGDLLTSLIQLCHAPIRKIFSYQMQESKPLVAGSDNPSNLVQTIIPEYRVPSCCKCDSLQDMLVMSEGGIEDDESKLIAEMWDDRRFLVAEFEELKDFVNPTLLIRELLMIQSSTVANNASSKKGARGHGWLHKACGFLLTACLIRNGGVYAVIEGVLDSDLASCGGEWKKYEAVAKFIANAPLQSTSVREYYSAVCHQVVTLLKTKNLSKRKVLLRIVSTVVFHLSLNQPGLAAEYIFAPLLQPFTSCFKQSSVTPKETIVSSEDDVMESIDILHKIFILGLEPNATLLLQLLPVYLPLFSLLVDTHGGVSYLRSSVTDLLAVLLKHQENPVDLLLAAAFDRRLSVLQPVASVVHFRHGSNGGIEIISTSQPFYEDWILEDEHKSAVILQLLKAINDAKLSAKFFLSLLQQLTAAVGETHPDSNLDLNDHFMEMQSTEDEMSMKLRQNLVLLSLLQELSSTVGETLVDDRSQVLTFVTVTLERGLESCDLDRSLQTETLLLSMGVLMMLVDQKHQLDADDWKELSNLIPVLAKLTASKFGDHVVDLADELMASIATRGALSVERGKRRIDVETPFVKAMQDMQSPSIPEQGHGLVTLRKLLEKKDPETIREKDKVLRVIEDKLKATDSYVYLIAIQALVSLGDIEPSAIITLLVEKFLDRETCEMELRMKIGEVLMQICRNLGELVVHYRIVLLNAFLNGAKDVDENIRVSSLSSLGELCKCLRFSIGPCIQEILMCLISIIRSDPSLQSRRAAVMVITLLLRGLGSDALKLLEGEMRDLYRELKWTYETDKDDVVRLHAQLSLEEVDAIMRRLFTPKKTLIKKINILDLA